MCALSNAREVALTPPTAHLYMCVRVLLFCILLLYTLILFTWTLVRI